ncbi:MULTISPECIES: ATP-binding protein [Anaerotruncus]|jgi:serine/threonine-protein kinase RsbT|uniref:Anti-sigma regulatory factor n=1 Tax=Anaerotruncus colihominis TaxID=169435 RepID=A0A845RGW2_9FIRM|nr:MULTISPECIES: ATP-binding protein [Anaerotruncus]MCI8491906.1 anti-sigma regulatory factor [Anaerotruncus sp.]MCR2026380.1 ATP-binding protein [Anaerotruncus colihominis]NBI79260.1 anti-sigma regulatory factor [Anaerotruncus colihominis]NDO40633.1 anti-sigma regulatory factor [Anaerotruncus colihominis]
MSESIKLSYCVPGDDFTRAGEASSDVKGVLKKLGLSPVVVRKVAIAMYEGEINMVIHGGGGQIAVEIGGEDIRMSLSDHGPGIPNIALAMQEGWSTAPEEVRNLGFGAGMGLPNMKKYSDEMEIISAPGEGTTVNMTVHIA